MGLPMDFSLAFSGSGGGSSTGHAPGDLLEPLADDAIGHGLLAGGPWVRRRWLLRAWGLLLLAVGGLVGRLGAGGVLDVLHQLFPLPLPLAWAAARVALKTLG